MKFSRRDFIKFGGIAALTTIGLSNNAFSFQVVDLLSNQNFDNFCQLIGEQFYLSTETNSFVATLANVKEFDNSNQNGNCYSLGFNVSAKSLKEATYDVFHPNIGNFQLFMNASKTGKKQTLLATINRF